MGENVLSFRFIGRDQVSGMFDHVANKAEGLQKKIDKFGVIATRALVGVGAAAGTVVGAAAMMGVKTASSLEQAQIGFTALLGSAKEAQSYLNWMAKFAATTPFDMPGLVDSSRKLIGVGVSAKQAKVILQDWGDTAGAVGIDADHFSLAMLALSQSIAAGHIKLGDMNQLANDGIPIWKLLSESLHKPVPEIQKMISHGELLTKDVLPKLNAQMKKDYGGSMAKQSKTLNGLWSTLKDTLNLGLAAAIKPLIPDIKKLLDRSIDLATWMGDNLPKDIQATTDALKGTRTQMTKTSAGITRLILTGEAFVQGIQTIAHEVQHAWIVMALAAAKTGLAVDNAFAGLPGSIGKHFRESAKKAQDQVTSIQRDLDDINTKRAQDQLDEAAIHSKWLKSSVDKIPTKHNIKIDENADDARRRMINFSTSTNKALANIRDEKVRISVTAKAYGLSVGAGDFKSRGDGEGINPSPKMNINPAPFSTSSLGSYENDDLERVARSIGKSVIKDLKATGAGGLIGGPGGGNAMGWRRQWGIVHGHFPGAHLNSAYRPGARTVSGNQSYHALGRAIDVTPSMAIFNWLRANYGRQTKELIFSPAGNRQLKNGRNHFYTGAVRAMHFNHVHWAMDEGGVAEGMGWWPKATRKPERVLSPRATAAFENLVPLLNRGVPKVSVNADTNIDYGLMGAHVARALGAAGLTVMMDGRAVGNLQSRYAERLVRGG